MISGCAEKSQSSATDTVNAQPAETTQDYSTTLDDDSASTDDEILIIIDQTPKPIEGGSFDFVVEQVPEGFALAEMQWITPHTIIASSVQEAIENGANGEFGFYISGNGQFSGFMYLDYMRGEEGEVVFIFKDAHGNELTWKKKLTL